MRIGKCKRLGANKYARPMVVASTYRRRDVASVLNVIGYSKKFVEMIVARSHDDITRPPRANAL